MRRTLYRSMILGVILFILIAPQAFANGQHGHHAKLPILLGTTGACDNEFRGGPCTTQSTLVQLDPETGGLIREIGPVGYTVNGLAWDGTSGKLYATTPPGDTRFHGLITINPHTGRGKPVDRNVMNFGLAGEGSPVHSITIDVFGNLVGWYDESFPAESDTYVRIDQKTGIAEEFVDTGINTSQNGVSFGEFNLLWNFDAPRVEAGGTLTQTAYILNPFNGEAFSSFLLSPPTPVALGDFNPVNNLYYGLEFDTAFDPPRETFIHVVDPMAGTVTLLGQTVDDLHTLTFISKQRKMKK